MKKREKERFYVEIDPYRLPISLPTFYSIAVVPVSNKAITHLPVPSFNDLIHSSNVATSSADGSGIYVTTSPYVPNTSK